MSASVISADFYPSRTEAAHRAGQGNWHAFRALALDVSTVLDAASDWKRQIEGVRLPWLCWNVHEDWCIVQQRLVENVGWTPIVGYDPRVGPPKRRSKNAIVIDFNAEFGLPVLYPHFPLEFSFAFADRFAFWHSDLLMRKDLLQSIADRFSELPEGSTAATADNPGLRELFSVRKKRYWELIGCTTRDASKLQFDAGCGWWMSFQHHPNCPSERERLRRQKYYWDHGAGIFYWHKILKGSMYLLRDQRIHEGHFTKIGNPDYRRSTSLVNGSDAQRSMNQEITLNFEVMSACQRLGLLEFFG